MSEAPKKAPIVTGEWLVMGIALGVAFGIIFDNLGLWLPIGVCVGLIGPGVKKRIRKNNNEPDKE